MTTHATENAAEIDVHYYSQTSYLIVLYLKSTPWNLAEVSYEKKHVIDSFTFQKRSIPEIFQKKISS